MREQAVFGIALAEHARDRRRGPRSLAISGGGDDRPMQRLEPPAGARQLHRKPVEQRGMRRPRALGSEVLAGLDQAAAEVLRPDPVRSHPADQWIGVAGEPAREREAIARRPLVGGSANTAGTAAGTTSPGLAKAPRWRRRVSTAGAPGAGAAITSVDTTPRARSSRSNAPVARAHRPSNGVSCRNACASSLPSARARAPSGVATTRRSRAGSAAIAAGASMSVALTRKRPITSPCAAAA